MATKGIPWTTAQREAHRGFKHTSESRAKMRLIARARSVSYSKEEAERFERYYPISTQKEMLELFPDRTASGMRIFASRHGIKKTQETLYRCKSETQKGTTWGNDEARATRSANIKKLWGNPEYREHMSEVHRISNREVKLQFRCHFLYKRWRSAVYERDDFTCMDCQVRGGELEAHHIKKLAEIFDENNIQTLQEALDFPILLDTDNGVTLCRECHTRTRNYKTGKDTVSQA